MFNSPHFPYPFFSFTLFLTTLSVLLYLLNHLFSTYSIPPSLTTLSLLLYLLNNLFSTYSITPSLTTLSLLLYLLYHSFSTHPITPSLPTLSLLLYPYYQFFSTYTITLPFQCMLMDVMFTIFNTLDECKSANFCMTMLLSFLFFYFLSKKTERKKKVEYIKWYFVLHPLNGLCWKSWYDIQEESLL